MFPTVPLSPRLAGHLRSGQVSRVIYGSIIGLAVVLTMEAHPSTPVVAIGTLLATALAVALAELYSEIVGGRAQASVGSETEPFSRTLEVAGAVAFGIALPAGVGLIAAVLIALKALVH